MAQANKSEIAQDINKKRLKMKANVRRQIVKNASLKGKNFSCYVILEQVSLSTCVFI